MPYESIDNFISESSQSFDYSDRDFHSSSLYSDNSVFLYNEQSGYTEIRDSENGENQVDYSDYSDILGSIYTNCSVHTEQIESLSYQLDLLNTNVVTLNENIKFGVGFLFTLTFIIFIRTIFAVFNKVLGLNQA